MSPLRLLLAAVAVVSLRAVTPVHACSVDGGFLSVSLEQVPEQLPIGSVVGTLKFDSPASIRKLETLKPSPYFAFSSINYTLFVYRVLDIDSVPEPHMPQHMQIGCENLQGVPFEIDVWFYIVDINDNAPQFLPSSLYVFNVSEALPVLSEVGQLQATDADRDNLNVEYRIQPSAQSVCFSLQGKAGGYAAIKLARALDYEMYQQLSFQILAMDCATSGCQNDRRTTTATVIVNIKDADDQNPEFVGTPYEATIFDNATAGSAVLLVRAVDLDLTLHAELRYDLVVDDITRDVFQVNSSTGLVTVKNPMLLQKDFFYLLQLKVCQADDPAKRDSTTVVIRVLPASRQGPHFDRKLYELCVMEDSLVPMKLLTLIVRDTVEEQEVLFSLDASHDSAMFSLELLGPHSGELYLRQPLDFEKQDRYEMVARVSGPKQQEDTTTIAINVIDANDNNPQFDAAHYEFTVNSTVCGEVHATDRDIGTMLTYRIVGARFAELFSISENGELTLKGNQLDYTYDAYTFTVLAMDDGRPPRTGAAVVTFNLKPYLSLHRVEAAAAVQDSAEGYVSYALGAIAAVLLIAVVILVLCLARRSLQKQRKRRRRRSHGTARMGIDEHDDDEETVMRPLDGCTYMAISRLSADHMTVDYSEAKDSGLSDDASSHCHHQMSNGHCPSSSGNDKAEAADLQMLMLEIAAHEHYRDGGPVRARRVDSLLLLPPPDLWQSTERAAYDGGGTASRASALPADAPPADGGMRADRELPAAGNSGGGDAARGCAPREWHGVAPASRGASTSSSSSAAHVYEERCCVTARPDSAAGAGRSGACGGGSPQSQPKLVVRKSSLLARSIAAHQRRERCCDSWRKQQQQHRPLSATAGSPQQKRQLLRKKQLGTNKDSLLYGGDQAAEPDLSVTPFVRQCSLSPAAPAVSRRRESNR